jgi:hypothetical protein
MRKTLLLSSLLLANLFAVDTKQNSFTSLDNFSGQLKAMHVFYDKTNAFASEEGSGYLFTLNYKSPEIIPNLTTGGSFYINGDTGLTDWDNDKKDAQGMFTDIRGNTTYHLGQLYFNYKNGDFNAKVGRQTLPTPLTKIQASLMPNFYEAANLSYKASPNVTLSLIHINKISYGSRSAADASLIGEKTWTAGTSQLVVGQGTGILERAKFLNIGVGAGVAPTNGITLFGLSYKNDSLSASAYNYHAHDIATIFYAQSDYTLKTSEQTKLTLSAQYMQERETGRELAGKLDYSMYGLKAKFGTKEHYLYGAFNASDDTGKFLNPWGMDPAYTTSIYSRNVYRQDVNAYKVGTDMTLYKGLVLELSYAAYSQSKTLGWGTQAPLNDALERDIALVYNPSKTWKFRLFNAWRISEYNIGTTPANTREMNHVRFILWYNF